MIIIRRCWGIPRELKTVASFIAAAHNTKHVHTHKKVQCSSTEFPKRFSYAASGFQPAHGCMHGIYVLAQLHFDFEVFVWGIWRLNIESTIKKYRGGSGSAGPVAAG